MCLGTMTWGEQNNESEGHAQIDFALDHGINFIDTAELYSVPPKAETYGRTEEIIGTWLQKTGRRDDIILASKAAGYSEFAKHIRGGPHFTEKHLTQAVEGSLKRLQTDVIDLYQLHWPDRHTNYFGQLGFEPNPALDSYTPDMMETLQTLAKMIEQGKIKHWGLSNETAWGAMKWLQLAEQHNLPKPVSIQNPYSLLNRSYEVGLAEVSYRENIGLLAYSPLAFGELTGKYIDGTALPSSRLNLFQHYSRYSSEHARRATQRYCELAKEYGLSPTQLALAFVNDRPFVTSNIIGATSIQQLKENIETTQLTLNQTILDELNCIHAEFSNPCP